ncbi:focadhesin isoform X2 [Aricia agestis]|uniref:focadhesin isoform X2 n=1 Tax=Aricia agestis TaxID=91739 RepID=UPI001C208971|nr:focadhesin isoform X2 [Aricia agestis]
MDEIEYKLKTNNSVLIVNAIDKLILTIKSKYVPTERQKFVLENEELKYLREKCSSKDFLVSLTACQGLLALVELGVLEIAHTMSTVVTLLPATQNYTAIISTMAGLLVFDLKSRLIPGEPYKCQFTLRSPQHPFITVLEKTKDVEEDILVQMQALCTHPEYTVSSNSLELLRPVFLWLTYNPQRSNRGVRPWQLLLSLPQTPAQSSLLLACLSCQQIYNPKLIECTFAAYLAVVDSAIYQQRRDFVVAFLPQLARLCGALVSNGRDPRGCYNLIERCFSIEAPELKNVSGYTIMLLAENLSQTSALYLHELFNLCLNIISKYEYSAVCLNAFAGLSLQWLHLPSFLTNNALKAASKILDIYQAEKENHNLYMANLKANRVFQTLAHVDGHLYFYFKVLETWERIRDNPTKLSSWFDDLTNSNVELKLKLLPFFVGVVLDRQCNLDLVAKALRTIIDLAKDKKEVSVAVLPILVFTIANDTRPEVKLECLKGLPLMASRKENVPVIVSILNKLKANRGVPMSLLVMLYTSLAETQVRCFPYLQELLLDTSTATNDLKWEVDIAKAIAVKRICELRPSSHGLELVPMISGILNKCTDKSGAIPAALALDALRALWAAGAVAPAGAWRALQPRLAREKRPQVLLSLCNLLSAIPDLRSEAPDYCAALRDAARRLWLLLAEGDVAIVRAAAEALANYRIEDYTLKDVPEIYRRTVKLPASYCKTPADAARNPEDVLDYIPCEIWPEVFKYTNQDALSGVQQLVSRLMEREIKAYRSGVYQVQGIQTLTHLPPHSVVRGMLECFRKQVTSPSYDYSDTVLLAIMETLASEFPKPLPPIEMSFLHELYHRGAQWKSGCIRLAAWQASTSPSAKRLLENFLEGVVPGINEESDVMLIFDNLPILCRTMPPNSLRGPIEKCLAESYASLPRSKVKDQEEQLFAKQLNRIKVCLENDKIHEANRTLLCQIVEEYFQLIEDDSVAWPAYLDTCTALMTRNCERMSSASGWWEVSGALLRRAGAVRARLAVAALAWLNDAVDAHAAHRLEQEYSLQYIVPALKAANTRDKATREWFAQLMARTQVAFNEIDDLPSKLYLCDVLFLAVIVFSGLWCIEPGDAVVGSRHTRLSLMPAAAAQLMETEGWDDCALQLLEWLCHSRTALDAGAARACQRALVALRHTPQFTAHRVWTRLRNLEDL